MTLLSPYGGEFAYGFLFSGAGSGVADTLSPGLYYPTNVLWDLVPVAGEVGDYFPEGTNAGAAGDYWGTLYFNNLYWGTPDPITWSLQGKPSNTFGSLVGKPT